MQINWYLLASDRVVKTYINSAPDVPVFVQAVFYEGEWIKSVASDKLCHNVPLQTHGCKVIIGVILNSVLLSTCVKLLMTMCGFKDD